MQYFNIFITGLVEPAKKLYEQLVADNNYCPKSKKIYMIVINQFNENSTFHFTFIP